MFLVLLTIAAMNVNKMVVEWDKSYYEEEAFRQASVMANTLMAEIMSKKFDEYALSGASDTYYQSLSAFSSTLGSESWEGYNIPSTDYSSSNNWQRYYSFYNPGIPFDDVDDFKGYKRTGTSGGITGFLLSVDVNYAKKGWSGGPDSVIVTTTSKSYLKLIEIVVTNNTYFSMKDTDGNGTLDTIKLRFNGVKAY